MVVNVQTFEELALANPDRPLELHGGVVREKPPMALGHNRSMNRLGQLLAAQLDPDRYWVNTNSGHLKRLGGAWYVPDVCVIAAELIGEDLDPWFDLEVYSAPLPLVVEVWSPSTADYDLEPKIAEYQRRGDPEIWRLHPFERTLISRQPQPDGSYREVVHHSGQIRPIVLPDVTIDLDAIFPPMGTHRPPTATER